MTPSVSEDKDSFVLTDTSAIHSSVLVRFHSWPCPVWPCSASHLTLRLWPPLLTVSRCSTWCPTPPLVSFHHDVEFCCQHECLQLPLWVRKRWTPLLNSLRCCLWYFLSPLRRKQPGAPRRVWWVTAESLLSSIIALNVFRYTGPLTFDCVGFW